MIRRRSLEITVGIFIVSGVTLLSLFIFFITDLSSYFQPGYRLRVQFDSANGITDGSSVQYAGVEVGRILSVGIVTVPEQPVPQVELLIQLPVDVRVREDDVAAISTFGLLGEKYLEIIPGSGQGGILQPGGRLVGKPPVSTEHIIERSNEVLTELKLTLQGINDLVGDNESRIYLKEALREARDATRQWKLVGERLNLALSHAESGEGTLGKVLYDDDLHQRAVLLVEDLRANPWKLLARPKHAR
ncbi:MAG TPA: MlaD family protein [bacterium]